MTATTVDGVQVVTDEPTPAPMKPGGRPVYWQQTRTLTLADGRTVYGCQHCDYAHQSPHGIRPHLKAHKTARTGGQGDPADPVRTVLGQLAELDALRAERDEWKRRAQTAERGLRAIRKAIGGTG